MTTKGKKNLLITVANENYIDQAKQLFSSVYFNAGWKGDYMLLAHEIPEKKLKWFRDKGIFVKKCDAIHNELVGKFQCPPIRLIKFHLFTPELKKWNKIIYLDSDIIVRASLEDLTNKKGFWACSEGLKLKGHFIKKPKRAYNELQSNYNLGGPSFNSGVMVFDSDIITADTFSVLKRLFDDYGSIHVFGDQPTLNLFFYKKFKLLPYVYNTLVSRTNLLNIKPEKVKGIILHFTENKPWNPKNPFYREWKNNLDKADSIDLKRIQNPRSVWSQKHIKAYCKFLQRRKFIYFHRYIIHKTSRLFDKHIGLLGIFLKQKSPKIYNLLKTLK